MLDFYNLVFYQYMHYLPVKEHISRALPSLSPSFATLLRMGNFSHLIAIVLPAIIEFKEKEVMCSQRIYKEKYEVA